MCQHAYHRHPIFCIVPPYVLDEIVDKGTSQQRAAALRTKAVDNTFRALRLATQAARFAPQRNALPAPLVTLQKRRTIYTANHTQNLPGTPVRAEGQAATGDMAVDEAYEGLGATFDFFEQVFGRNSIDDAGMLLDATVHFGQEYNNAFWNSVQMVFGDGDGRDPLTASRLRWMSSATNCPRCRHVLSHGVTRTNHNCNILISLER